MVESAAVGRSRNRSADSLDGARRALARALVIHCAGITVGFDKDDNGTLQTRKFTPRDGNQRTVYEVVARSAHQIVRRNGKEAASDNAPDAKDQVVPAPEEHVESTDDGEIWPS
jgi:hypothetical protein